MLKKKKKKKKKIPVFTIPTGNFSGAKYFLFLVVQELSKA